MNQERLPFITFLGIVALWPLSMFYMLGIKLRTLRSSWISVVFYLVCISVGVLAYIYRLPIPVSPQFSLWAIPVLEYSTGLVISLSGVVSNAEIPHYERSFMYIPALVLPSLFMDVLTVSDNTAFVYLILTLLATANGFFRKTN